MGENINVEHSEEHQGASPATTAKIDGEKVGLYDEGHFYNPLRDAFRNYRYLIE